LGFDALLGLELALGLSADTALEGFLRKLEQFNSYLNVGRFVPSKFAVAGRFSK